MKTKNAHRFAILTSLATWLLLIAGALVTSTGSGLSVPDWPLSYGQWFPPMVGGVFFEHGHRMVAGTVALLTITLAAWIGIAENRRWVRLCAYTAVFLVLLQAVLGGLTVLLRLPPQISISHAMLGQTFFCLTVVLACVTSPKWEDKAPGYRPADRGLFIFSAAVSAGFFVQLFLGASIRHLHAGLAIPDFPAVYGGWLPPVWTVGIGLHFAHRWMAYVLCLCAAGLAIRILRREKSDRVRTFLAGIWIGCLAFQVLLGALTIWLRRPVPVTSAHLAVGALCLAVSVLLSFRLGWAAIRRMKKKPTQCQDLLALTKPGICVLALAMTALGYCVASQGGFDWLRFMSALVGTALIGAGCGALNQWAERDIDSLMHRTRNRPLPTGRIRTRTALLLGFGCLTLGFFLLLFLVNAVTALLGLGTFVIYLAAYTPMKRMNSFSTLVGAIPGAMPPLMGWTAAYGALAWEGWVLFAILFLWQIPHFLAIAWIYREDYARAGLPVLSVLDEKGSLISKQVLLYSSVLLPFSLVPSVLGVTGNAYFFGALILGILFFIFGVYLAIFRTKVYARRLFLASIVYLPALGILMALDHV